MPAKYLRLSRDHGAYSRRRFLQFSTIAGAAALAAGCSSAEMTDQGGTTIPDQQGRRVLITGGNGYPQNDRSGLGYQQALALARAGAEVVIASRNQVRGDEAVRHIRLEAPGARIRFETLDLANLASVNQFAARLRSSGQGLDLLINNAGVMGRRNREVSVDGFERVFATNTLGHFVLTAQLLPVLQRGRHPRVVWVASLRTADALPFDDLQGEGHYDYAAAYDQSKLANLMLALEFERRNQAAGWGIASLVAHPGVARTNLIPDGPGLDSPEGWRFRTLPFVFRPATQGALPILYAATSPQAMAGGYYGPGGFLGMRGQPGAAAIPAAAQDQGAAMDLWVALERLGQVSFG